MIPMFSFVLQKKIKVLLIMIHYTKAANLGQDWGAVKRHF